MIGPESLMLDRIKPSMTAGIMMNIESMIAGTTYAAVDCGGTSAA